MVAKGPLESPNGLFWKMPRHALRKTAVKILIFCGIVIKF